MGLTPVNLKAQVLGYATVLLENGDLLIVQTTVANVQRVEGSRTPDGKQEYKFDLHHGVNLVEHDT